jgi:hypothetical protein
MGGRGGVSKASVSIDAAGGVHVDGRQAGFIMRHAGAQHDERKGGAPGEYWAGNNAGAKARFSSREHALNAVVHGSIGKGPAPGQIG